MDFGCRESDALGVGLLEDDDLDLFDDALVFAFVEAGVADVEGLHDDGDADVARLRVVVGVELEGLHLEAVALVGEVGVGGVAARVEQVEFGVERAVVEEGAARHGQVVEERGVLDDAGDVEHLE